MYGNPTVHCFNAINIIPATFVVGVIIYVNCHATITSTATNTKTNTIATIAMIYPNTTDIELQIKITLEISLSFI